jgi:hypothetical protein
MANYSSKEIEIEWPITVLRRFRYNGQLQFKGDSDRMANYSSKEIEIEWPITVLRRLR